MSRGKRCPGCEELLSQHTAEDFDADGLCKLYMYSMIRRPKPTLENPTMSKSSKNSRSPESRRERRIIRNWLKSATLLNANVTLSPDEVVILTVMFNRADEALSTLPGYKEAK